MLGDRPLATSRSTIPSGRRLQLGNRGFPQRRRQRRFV
ncbi:hypothetical protein I552_6130 [Mycobacterium xenopi 3993]|nr:hypothetical protein I552_6130 [Mycobacterium xenopi 3993]